MTAINYTDTRAEIVGKAAKKGGFRARIDAKCAECLYDPYAEGSWRKQVENCTSHACPLYPVRPKSKGGAK